MVNISKLSKYIGDTDIIDIIARFRVRQLHVAVVVIQLSPTVTKLCHIKCDHPACVSADGGHFVHDVNWVVALNMA